MYILDENKKWSERQVVFDCDYCGTENVKLLSGYHKKAKHHFCDNKCSSLFVKEKWAEENKYNCDFCGNEFSIPRHRTERSKHNYCSVECKQQHHGLLIKGENHVRYIKKNIVHCEQCQSILERHNWQVDKFDIFFCNRDCQAKWISENKRGEDSNNWRGGINPLFNQIRTSLQYSKWRLDCFERDHFKCTKCNDNKGGNLNAHHIIHFNDIIMENNILTWQDAVSCELLWDINNGTTLCIDCHKEEHGRKS